MSRRRFALGAIVLASFAACLAVLAAWLKPQEPVYQGQALSYWVEELENLSNERAAREALREIGPRAIPFLVAMARRVDSLPRTWCRAGWPLLPRIVQTHVPKPDARIDSLRRVAMALAEVGPSSIPALSTMLRDCEGGVRVNALIGLARMKGDKTPAVPCVLGALTNSESALTPGNPSALAGVKRMAATVLGEIGPGAQAAVLELLKLLTCTNAHTRAQAVVALWRITDDARYISLLVADLEKAKDAETINRTVEALGDIGAAAIVALPAVRKKFAGQGMSGDLLDAVLKIDPDAVLRENATRLR